MGAGSLPLRWRTVRGRPPGAGTNMKRMLLLSLLIAQLAACATSPTGRRQLMLISED
jgi:hypothetical protein